MSHPDGVNMAQKCDMDTALTVATIFAAQVAFTPALPLGGGCTSRSGAT